MESKSETKNGRTRRKVTSRLKVKRVLGFVVLLVVVGLTPSSISTARANENNQSLDLPSPLCDSIRVDAENRLALRVYALGVQVYSWNGTAWVFVEPAATLFAKARYQGEVGTHYVGPTWESNSGSKVVAARVPGTGCTPDSTAIPWLLLKKVSTEGAGIFATVTYIQRVNTTGGTVPTTPGSYIGQVSEVPYTAEYYFYRAQD